MKYRIVCILLFFYKITIYSQNINYAKEIISTLASEEFKGRGYVDNGNKIAADYIRDEFSKNGLKPFSGSYFQPFQINVNTFPGDVALKLGDVDLFPGRDFILDPTCPSIKGEFDVYTIKREKLANEEMFNQLQELVAGKVLVIDERNYDVGTNDEELIKDRINYLKYAVEVPSYATIILTSEKLTWSNSVFQFKKAAITVNSDIDISAIDKVIIEIEADFIRYETNNIVGYIEGAEKPDSFLLFTAHYDHLGMMGKKTYFPGANDNASGVAMLLSLAKYFKQDPPKYSMAFIALSAEEIGILGAKYFTGHPLLNLGSIKFLINFDLAGTGEDGIKVVNGSVYSERFQQLKEINATNDLLASVQSRGEACNSDHCMFYKKGVPCFYIYTLGGISAYHDINDKAETLPLTEFEDYLKLITSFIKGF